MKRVLYRLFAATLALVICIGITGGVLAAARASFYLTRYVTEVIPDTNGVIHIKVSVSSNQTSTELGASYILLEESSDSGRSWHVAREYEDESWMTATNRRTYTRAITYQGTIGYQYRATADVFAKDANGGDSRTTPTSPAITATR